MLTKRIIACLDVDGGRVVKGIEFQNLRDAGDPAELARAHAGNGADEIVLLDISATAQKRATLLDTVRRTASQIFVPFTVGGGIRSLDEASAVFDAGCDKISINSAAVKDPSLITCIGERFGSQAVIVAIDARKDRQGVPSGYRVFVTGGRIPTERDAVEWAKEAESSGAGEILLTSMDRDGTGIGFECELTALIASAVSIPVIASGGAGSIQHFVDVFREGKADAALAASIFHFGVHDIRELKKQVSDAGIPMRLPC
jgi:imidazole glycerol-phosphate synthase subunit HisF